MCRPSACRRVSVALRCIWCALEGLKVMPAALPGWCSWPLLVTASSIVHISSVLPGRCPGLGSTANPSEQGGDAQLQRDKPLSVLATPDPHCNAVPGSEPHACGTGM